MNSTSISVHKIGHSPFIKLLCLFYATTPNSVGKVLVRKAGEMPPIQTSTLAHPILGDKAGGRKIQHSQYSSHFTRYVDQSQRCYYSSFIAKSNIHILLDKLTKVNTNIHAFYSIRWPKSTLLFFSIHRKIQHSRIPHILLDMLTKVNAAIIHHRQ